MSFVCGSVVTDGETKEMRSVVSREVSIEKVGVESKDTVAVTGAFFVVAMVCSGAINEAGWF